MKTIVDISNDNRDLVYHPNKHLWFEPIDNNKYVINTDLEYILEYVTINYDTLSEDSTDYDAIFTNNDGKKIKAKIYSYDPSGGPFISVGNYKIDGKTVKRIYQSDNKTFFEVE